MKFESIEHEIPYEGYIIKTEVHSPTQHWSVTIIGKEQSSQLDALYKTSELAFEAAKKHIDSYVKLKGGAVSDDAIDFALLHTAKRRKNPNIMQVNLEESATKVLRLWGKHIAECKINDVDALSFPEWLKQVQKILADRGEELHQYIEGKRKGDE